MEISLMLTVREGSSPNMLDEIVPHVNEVVVLFCPRLTLEPLRYEHLRRDWITYLSKVDAKGHTITFKEISHQHYPGMFRVDEPATFRLGGPYNNEKYPEPFSHTPFVGDWSAIRNLGLSLCTKPWRLLMVDNERFGEMRWLSKLCNRLTEDGNDVAYVPHQFGPRYLSKPRVVGQSISLHFAGAARERLLGAVNPVFVQNITTHEAWSRGVDVARDHHDFKTLYAEARSMEWILPPTDLVQLARTSRLSPDFSESILNLHLGTNRDPETEAWNCCLQGELAESFGERRNAVEWYLRGLSACPNTKIALRLSNVHFMLSNWARCLEYYQTGIELKDKPILWDDGIANLAFTLIYVAVAQQKLGRVGEAIACSETLRKIFPRNQRIAELHRSLT